MPSKEWDLVRLVALCVTLGPIWLLIGCTDDTLHIESVATAPATAANHPDMVSAQVKDYAACSPKQYPHDARINLKTGISVLDLLIGVDGRIRSVKIATSSGTKELDDALVASYSSPTCLFNPATSKGVPLQAWHRISYTWKLE